MNTTGSLKKASLSAPASGSAPVKCKAGSAQLRPGAGPGTFTPGKYNSILIWCSPQMRGFFLKNQFPAYILLQNIIL